MTAVAWVAQRHSEQPYSVSAVLNSKAETSAVVARYVQPAVVYTWYLVAHHRKARAVRRSGVP